MDPKDIFELIIKADEKLKYATSGTVHVRKQQARELLVQALEAAREIGNENLVQQAETRLSDLGMPPVSGGSGSDDREDMSPVHGSTPPASAAVEDGVRRPNPLDPYPEPRPQAESGDKLAYPPGLGPDAIAILEGRTSSPARRASRTRLSSSEARIRWLVRHGASLPPSDPRAGRATAEPRRRSCPS